MLIPSGPLRARLDRSQLSVDTAQEHLYEARMHDVARVVRDALPTATHLLIHTNPLSVPSSGVVLHAIYGGDGAELWVRERQAPTELAAYRASDGTTLPDLTWPQVVRHLEHELTHAIGADGPYTWWQPQDDEDDNGFCVATLPTADEVAAIQTERPRHLAAYLADRDAADFTGLWHVHPVPHPTMSVAGVAITASVADDGVLTVDIDPTGTPPQVMPPAGPGTPIRVRLTDSAMPQPDLAHAGPGVDADSTRQGSISDPDAPTAGVGTLEDLERRRAAGGPMDRDVTHPHPSDRAGFAAGAVLAYARRIRHLSDVNNEIPQRVLAGLLGDLRHFADAVGLDYADADRRGQQRYEADRRGES